MVNITPDAVNSIPSNSIVTTTEAMERLGDDFGPWLRAWAMGQYAGSLSPELVESIMREAVPEEWQDETLGEAMLQESLRLNAEPDAGYGSLVGPAWEQAVAVAVTGGDIEAEIPVDSFLDDQFIEAVTDFDPAAVEQDVDQYLSEGSS